MAHTRRRKIAGEFLRFSVIGAIGFLADTAILYLCLYGFGLGHFSGRLISYLSAATTTWYLNRQITFREADPGMPHRQWAKFLVVNGLGGFVNYATYATLVLQVQLVADNPVLGVAAGSISGLAFNFVASRQLVFRHSKLLKRPRE